MSSYSLCARPDASHRHPYLVFDCQGELHLPLIVFAKEAQARLARSSVKKYLTNILQCRVKPHQQGGEWLETNEEAVNPVRLLLCGLKLFYRIAQAHGYYQHDNPLSSSFTEMAEAAREHFVRDDDGSMRPPNA